MGRQGLSEAEAAARLKADGPNELPRNEQTTAERNFLEVLQEPMPAMPLGGGVIYLLLGDAKEASRPGGPHSIPSLHRPRNLNSSTAMA